MAIKLHDILASKKAGDEWYAIEAPEELKVWTFSSGWKRESFSEHGMALLAVRVKTSAEVGPTSRINFSRKNSVYTKSGAVIEKGFKQVRQVKTFSATIRVDSIIQLNDTLRELSELEEFDDAVWEVLGFDVFRNSEASLVQFRIHNPDGTGPSLYGYRFDINGDEGRLYPDVYLADQQRIIGTFRNKVAYCYAKEVNTLGHGCQIKDGIVGMKAIPNSVA